MRKLLLASTLAFAMAFANGALASPSDDARQHFQAIGAGDVASLMRGYAEGARLNWVGGPLDGTYTGAASIQGVWEKFAKAAGKSKVDVDELEESANPKGATVTAKVRLDGNQKIKVRYVLTYREGKLVDETWQIDPKLSAKGG